MDGIRRKLPKREYVFILSLMYHGFRFTHKRRDLKNSRGYIIPATYKEDANGIDFWVKMPKDMRLFPIQVTQRGVRMYKKHHHPSVPMLQAFMQSAAKRLRAKRHRCRNARIGFVLVRDFDGALPSTTIAWGDIKALRHALAVLCLRLPPA